MSIQLSNGPLVRDKMPLVVLVTQEDEFKNFLPLEEERNYVEKKLKNEAAFYQAPGKWYYFIKINRSISTWRKLELIRRQGAEIAALCSKEEAETIQVSGKAEEALALAEGIMLASYSFVKYKKEKKVSSLNKIIFTQEVPEKELRALENVVAATCIARDLVNEPAQFLTAVQLGEEITRLGEEAGFKVEVLHKARIESLKMGGLLGVNQGSVDPPTFNILEYRHPEAINAQPIVLIGKGVVYDTGGLSLKDSTGMMTMKCDMAGAAAVTGAFYAAAKNKLPLYLVGLIPATDNRPSGNALVPGDVITISNGKTVEVLNTDAEGRLILADALVYASRYKPLLAIDLATLTGAAARAIGKEGIVYMGNASEEIHAEFRQCGEEVFERLVQFPLWEEYASQLQSDIADIKNLGDGDAGAITAGKFLEYFVDYPWLHLDIAGPAFIKGPDHYRTKNGTGVGVRLLHQFLKKQAGK